MKQAENGWTPASANHLYQIDRWSCGFYEAGPSGRMVALPRLDSEESVDLWQLVDQARSEGFSPPLLIRFPEIAQCRLQGLYAAFEKTISDYQYNGSYSFIYPIKVCQQREVVASLLATEVPRPIGLEAGSKAELLAIISTARPETPILCNGFKDASYISLALHAASIGHNVAVIIEKPSEVSLLRQQVERHDVLPRIGVRIKLAAKGVGHWESTGGTKSKFGLTMSELMAAVDQLREADLLEQVRIVHFHLGSQITEIRYLKNAVIEATRVYSELLKLGAPVKVIDVGGGLGVNYCGRYSTNPSSINYSLQEYVNDVVYHIQTVCDRAGAPHPDIYTESGRAVTAHHSVLVMPIFGANDPDADMLEEEDPEHRALTAAPLSDLRDTRNELSRRNLLESYHDAEQSMEMAAHLFRHGHLSLVERAQAERLFKQICRTICDQLSFLNDVPGELRALEELLADHQFANVSIFRSLPDHWAIDQVFPIAPLQRLDERPNHRVIIGDITCDSDGRIRRYLSPQGEMSNVLLHQPDGSDYYLGVFLVGAYQEILGDSHNLFGRVHVMTVSGNGAPPVISQPGEMLGDVLATVGYTPEAISDGILQSIERASDEGRINASRVAELKASFQAAVDSYTYLSVAVGPKPAHQPGDGRKASRLVDAR